MSLIFLKVPGVKRVRCCSSLRAASISENRRARPGTSLRTTTAYAAISDLSAEPLPFPIPPPKEVDSDGEVTAVEDPEATDEIVHDLSVCRHPIACLKMHYARFSHIYVFPGRTV